MVAKNKINIMKKSLLVILFLVNLGMSCKPSSTREEYVKPEPTIQNKVSDTTIKVELVVSGLFVPWSIVFTDEGRMLITERNGKLRVFRAGTLLEKPLKVFNDVASGGEEGLMGLALDPNYKNNKFTFVSYAYDKGDKLVVKVVRFKDNGDSLSGEKIIIDNLPAEKYHAGCRLRFGPDGKLYITTGDAGERESAQDVNSLYGKIYCAVRSFCNISDSSKINFFH
jgi:glucose/arabinose dehydrogenase